MKYSKILEGVSVMMLKDLREESGWIFSEWQLTYGNGWEQICKAVALIYSYTDSPEVLVDDVPVPVNGTDDILRLPEARSMVIRGMSKMLMVPVSITFFNQLNFVRATVGAVNDEFRNTDYRKFNFSMCQFMDSIELTMYR